MVCVPPLAVTPRDVSPFAVPSRRSFPLTPTRRAAPSSSPGRRTASSPSLARRAGRPPTSPRRAAPAAPPLPPAIAAASAAPTADIAMQDDDLNGMRASRGRRILCTRRTPPRRARPGPRTARVDRGATSIAERRRPRPFRGERGDGVRERTARGGGGTFGESRPPPRGRPRDEARRGDRRRPSSSRRRREHARRAGATMRRHARVVDVRGGAGEQVAPGRRQRRPRPVGRSPHGARAVYPRHRIIA